MSYAVRNLGACYDCGMMRCECIEDESGPQTFTCPQCGVKHEGFRSFCSDACYMTYSRAKHDAYVARSPELRQVQAMENTYKALGMFGHGGAA